MPRRASGLSKKLGVNSPGNRVHDPGPALERVAACEASILGHLEAEGRRRLTWRSAHRVLGREGFTDEVIAQALARLCWRGTLEPDVVAGGQLGYRRPRLAPAEALAALREAQRAYLAASGWKRQPTPARPEAVAPEDRGGLWDEETWAHPQLGASALDRASTLQATLDTWAQLPAPPGAMERAAAEVSRAAAGLAGAGPGKARRTP